MIPHVCPNCKGEKLVMRVDGSTNRVEIRPCPTCNSEGVVWQTELKDVSSTGHKDGDMLRKTSAGEIN